MSYKGGENIAMKPPCSAFTEKDVRAFYRFLDLTEYDVRIVKGPVAAHEFFYNEDAFVEHCIKYNGVRNIYAGINQRCKNGTKNNNVVSINTIFVDLDVVRNKGISATEEQLVVANNTADTICRYYVSGGFRKPNVVCSGNGFHLYSSIKPIKITDENREEMSKKLKIFGNHLKNKFSDGNKNGIRIDSTFDLARVVGIPGTLSIKEGAPLLRKIQGTMRKIEDEKLSKYIETIVSPYEKESSIHYVPKPQDNTDGLLDYVLKVDNKFLSLYNGNISSYPSRSEAEMALASKCAYYGLDIDYILSSSLIGKWTKASNNYKQRTIEKANQLSGGRKNV